MTISKTGDWLRARRFFNGFTFRMGAAATGGLALDAHGIAKDVRGLILKGGPAGRYPVKWKPLADATVEKKGHDHPLMDSGDYVDAIRVINLGRGSFGVGVTDPVLAKRGLSQEYGAEKGGKAWGGRIPARPHWRPVITQYASGGVERLALYRALAAVFGRGKKLDAPTFTIQAATTDEEG